VLAPFADVTTELVLQHVVDAISLGSLYALFALGIALIFGIMRLINFAHGELVMAGAFAIVLVPLPDLLLIPVALALVVALALAVERIAFRPVRDARAETLLITSFALSFLLQNLAALIWGSTPRATDFASGLGDTFTIASISIQKLDVVIVGVTLASLVGLGAFLRRTTLGRQMRAAAEDFRMARVLGVRADTVVAAAFGLSGLLAGIAAILLTAQTGTVSPTLGVNVVLFAFIATIVGGMGSLPGAVAGGFSIGALTIALQAALPIELRPYRDAFVFGAVLVALVVRPQGLLPAAAVAAREVPRRARLRLPARTSSAGKWGEPADPQLGRRPRDAFLTETVWPPAALIALTCLVTLVSWVLGPDSLDRVVVGMVINLIVVVGLYTFVGLSGVFSFGHAAFMAIGAYAGAILVIPPETKEFVLPDLPGFLARVHLDPLPATVAAGGIAAAVALVLSVPLARLSGLTAGLASFAVLVIVNVVAKNWQQVTHGTAGVAGIPTATTVEGALAWALVAIAAAWALQRSAIGLRLRASREHEAAARSIGIGVARERAVAFVVSAFFVGVAGALLGMFIGSFNPDAFFLNITFLMVVMLVIGGTTSLSGAVVGSIVISGAAEILRRIEGGVDLGLVEVPSRPGLREVGLALLMLAILIRRPNGLTGGRELHWPARKKVHRPDTEAVELRQDDFGT
jgi:branched-chain amino acid transport system permease protein